MTNADPWQVYTELLAAKVAKSRKKGGARRLPGTTRADILLAAADEGVCTIADLAKALGCSQGTIYGRIAMDLEGTLGPEVTKLLAAHKAARRAQ